MSASRPELSTLLPNAPSQELWLEWQSWLPLALSVSGLDGIPESTLRAFQYYASMLEALNRHVNLVRIPNRQSFLYRHLLDCLTLLPLLPGEAGRSVLDVGSGGGFPLIPLALLRPDLNWHGVEATGKKVHCLQLMSHALALHATLHHARVEDLNCKDTHRHQYDRVTSRAVAPLARLLPWVSDLLKPGHGQLLAMKGNRADDEKIVATGVINTHKWHLQAEHHWPTIEPLQQAVVQVWQNQKCGL